MDIQTQTGPASWYFPPKRGRGRPRKSVDTNLIVSLYFQGKTYQQIAHSCEVSVPIVSKIVRELIQEGKIKPRKPIRDYLFAVAREKRAGTIEKIIVMYNQMIAYEQIGNTLGVTRERVRQHIQRAVAENGKTIFQERENFISLKEARNRLRIRVPLALFRIAYANGEIPGLQNICSRNMYVDWRYRKIIEQWARKVQSRTCIVCGKAFVITSELNCQRVSCSKLCSKIRSEQIKKTHRPNGFRGWRRIVYDRLRGFDIAMESEWVGYARAKQISGLTSMKLYWLVNCEIIATRGNLNKKSSHGNPTYLFSRGQMEVVKAVLQETR